MIKVKTFASSLQIFQARKELEGLDERVNRFLAQKNVSQVISVNDACTTDNTGATIGVIRVVTYQA